MGLSGLVSCCKRHLGDKAGLRLWKLEEKLNAFGGADYGSCSGN